jgi:hypothetical protein
MNHLMNALISLRLELDLLLDAHSTRALRQHVASAQAQQLSLPSDLSLATNDAYSSNFRKQSKQRSNLTTHTQKTNAKHANLHTKVLVDGIDAGMVDVAV